MASHIQVIFARTLRARAKTLQRIRKLGFIFFRVPKQLQKAISMIYKKTIDIKNFITFRDAEKNGALIFMILGNILRRTSKLYSKNESLIYENNRFTWAETQKRVNALVNGLLNLKIQKGDRIAVLSDNSHRYLELYLAAAHAGFIIVPLNAMFKPGELKALLKNADVSVLFCGKNYLDKKDVLRNELPEINYIIGLENHDCIYDYEHLIKENSSKDTIIDVSPDDIFAIAYTSGTTGNSKGAVLTHRSCYTAALIHSLEWRVSQADNYLFLGRLFFAAGGPKFIPFVRGCKIVVTNFEPQKTMELIIEKEKISFFSTGPTIINLLVNHPDISRYNMESIRSIGFTSAPMPAALWEKANEVLGDKGVSTYGLTETNTTGLVLQPEDVYPLDTSARTKRFGSVGKNSTLVDVKVIDKQGQEVPHDGKERGRNNLNKDASRLQGIFVRSSISKSSK